MAKQNPNVTISGVFQKNKWKAFLSNLFPAVPSSTAFFKGIYFIKHCVIVTSNNYYVIDSHFIAIIFNRQPQPF